MAQQIAKQEPLVIQAQGSFAVGGKVVRAPGTFNNNAPTADGQSLHGDHLYAFYQVPQDPKPLPIVMLHGAYQSGRSWETTSDGREGFQNIFLRWHFPVYLVDQPRRGRAGNSTVAATIEPIPYDQLFFDQFRIGTWPNYFDGVQFDRKPETLNQFFRSVTGPPPSHQAIGTTGQGVVQRSTVQSISKPMRSPCMWIARAMGKLTPVFSVEPFSSAGYHIAH